MRWIEMALVALAVDLVLIAVGLMVVRRALRQAMGPLGLYKPSGASLTARKEKVAAP